MTRATMQATSSADSSSQEVIMEPGVPRRRQQKILLVDDNADNLVLLRALLSMRGYDVTTAASAEEARELLARNFDLILLDVVLPGASGFELCHEIKGDPATRL